MYLPGDLDGNQIWGHGMVWIWEDRTEMCVHICSGLCCRWWDASTSAGTGVFCNQRPVCRSQLLSSARISHLKASSGLRSARFSAVYGQAKRKCPHGQSVRTPCCRIRLFLMLMGIIFIYILDSPFCLIKKKKKILLYLKQNQLVLSPPTPHSIMIKIAT